jgi:hypothetical protein
MPVREAISERGFRQHELRIRRRLAYRVADTCFGMFSNDEITMVLDPGLLSFSTNLCRCEVRIGVDWADDIQMPNGAPSFDSGGLWTAFEESSGHRFYFSTPHLGRAPYKTLWIDRSFSQGRLLLRRSCFDATRPIYPLEYPLDELLMIHRLARGVGVEMHAMGLIGEDGRGHLFLGHSGAGKSTAARLWQSESAAHILSDDRIVLRVRDGQVWMYGTPWHGDAGIASPAAAPLYRAYLLEHGHKSELTGISRGRAAAEFLARCFTPHYSAEALQFTLQFLDRVAQAVPCFLFRFLPDQSAVEAICRAAA